MKKSEKKYKKYIILLPIFVVIIVLFISLIIHNPINVINDAKKAQIENNELINLKIEVKQEYEDYYECVLTFQATNMNEKIKQIEYITNDKNNGEVLLINSGIDQLSIDYNIDKNDIKKDFKITTMNGTEETITTTCNITYDDCLGHTITKEVLKGYFDLINLDEQREGYYFAGWSLAKDSSITQFFEDYKDRTTNKDTTFYAVWLQKKDGLTKEYENDSLIGIVSKIKESGKQTIEVEGQSYDANVIVIKKDLLLDGINQVEGSTLNNNIYEFGDNTQDVATASDYAKNMVILKVDGNIVISPGVTLTACKSSDGYGGPKGLLIYCSGTILNRGTIDMTARGAKAIGQDVYLWKNNDETYEYVPKTGATGGNSIYVSAGRKNNKWK